MKKTNKLPARRITSDDCAIYIDREVDVDKKEIINKGTPYYVHKGEWLDILPLVSVRQFIAWNKLTQAFSGDINVMEAGLNELCIQLSNRIIQWNWTDNEGYALPQPYKNPEVLKELSDDEILWLASAMVETPGQRKNAGAPSA